MAIDTIGNPPLNVFRGLRVHPNKLKIDKKRSRSQRAASSIFS